MQTFFKVFFFLLVGVNPTFPDESIADAKRVGIEVVIVEEVALIPNADGAYVFKDGRIELRRKSILGGRKRADSIIAHEVAHKVRYENNLMKCTVAEEEAIAVYSSEAIAKILFGISYKFNEKRILRATLKINGLTEVENPDIIESEVRKTVALVKRLYGKGE